MLSRISRWLTYLNAFLYAITGAALFILPVQLAPVFAWKVTAFMTITIGGWCLGNAWLAWITARRWEWRLVYTSLIYLWLFGLIEMAVLIAFRAKLKLGHPIAWLYLATLMINVITALVGIFDWLRNRPSREPFGLAANRSGRGSVIAFIIFVGFLAAYGLFVQVGAPGTNGGIFPEVMSLFTLRAFAAFYLSLTLGAIPLLFERNLAPFLHHALAAYGLIIAITAAAFIYLRVFDLVKRPGGLLYFGAYLIVGIPLLFIFKRYGTGSDRSRPS
jgi:hypothetical protein